MALQVPGMECRGYIRAQFQTHDAGSRIYRLQSRHAPLECQLPDELTPVWVCMRTPRAAVLQRGGAAAVVDGGGGGAPGGRLLPPGRRN